MDTSQTFTEERNVIEPYEDKGRLFKSSLGLRRDQEHRWFNVVVIGHLVSYVAALTATIAAYYFFINAALFARYGLQITGLWENHIAGSAATVGLAFYTVVTILILKLTPLTVWRKSQSCWENSIDEAIATWLEKRRLQGVFDLGLLVLGHVIIFLALIYGNSFTAIRQLNIP